MCEQQVSFFFCDFKVLASNNCELHLNENEGPWSLYFLD